MSINEPLLRLQSQGFFIGDRDPARHVGQPGKFMICEKIEDPNSWCIVGDRMDLLLRQTMSTFAELLSDGFLDDWQNHNPLRSTPYCIDVDHDRIDLDFPELGTSIWIEFQDERVRVHGYSVEQDEPTTLELYPDQVKVSYP